MSGLSDYLENKFALWLKGTQMPTPPAGLYVALFNGDPTDAGTGGADVTTTIRTAGRVAVTFDISVGVLTSNAAVDFGTAAAAATISHFGIYDAASGGNLLALQALTGGSKTVGAGTNVLFASGALTIILD